MDIDRDKILNSIVNDLLMEHEGGEIFFDHLDEIIRTNKNLMDQLYENIIKHIDLRYINGIVVTGRFGKAFELYAQDRMMHYSHNFIKVEGGLRKNIIRPLDGTEYDIKDGVFIFVDDSYYSGTTFWKTKNEIERLGGKIKKLFVVYDGCRDEDYNRHSLYRYYDNYK